MARESLRLVSRTDLTWLESTAFARIPWLIHGFSTRLGPAARSRGADASHQTGFNLGITPGAQPKAIDRNRKLFCAALGDFRAIASLKQLHTDIVYEVSTLPSETLQRCDASHGGTLDRPLLDYRLAGYLPQRTSQADTPSLPSAQKSNRQKWPCHDAAGDALLTAEPGVLLSIRVADCLPVLIADRRQRVTAAIHAGWRGALARIVEKTVGELRRIFNSRPEDLSAALGPSIGRCCYEVGDEVVEAFASQFVESDSFLHKPPKSRKAGPDRHTVLFHTQASPGHQRPRPALHLDLAAVARAQLLAAGLEPSAIHATAYCTACRDDLFFSHRRDGVRAGRMMAAIGIRQ